MGLTEEEYKQVRLNLLRAKSGKVEVKKRGKFTRSKPEDRTLGGTTYASKAEMRFAVRLQNERLVSPAMWWVRQPVFDLLGAKYTPDFLVLRWSDEAPHVLRSTVYEIKPKLREPFRSNALRTFRRNRTQVKAMWGVDVELVEME